MLPSEFEAVNLIDPNISWGVISGFPSRAEYPITDRARLDEIFSDDVQHSYMMRQLIHKEGLEFTCADGLWTYQDTHQIFDRSFVIFCHDDDERLDRAMRNLEQRFHTLGSVRKRLNADSTEAVTSSGATVRRPLLPENTIQDSYSLTRHMTGYRQIHIGISENAGFMNAVRLHTYCKRLNGSPVDQERIIV